MPGVVQCLAHLFLGASALSSLPATQRYRETSRSGASLLSQRVVAAEVDDEHGPDGPRIKELPSMDDQAELKEWCEKSAYAVDFDHAAYHASNLTNGEGMSKEGHTGYFHLHTPKVAGVSFREDLAGMIADGVTIDSHEGCFGDNAHPLHGTLMMVREPRQHVFSQYSFCATSPDVGPSLMHDLMPGSFESWIDAWVTLHEYNSTKGNFTVGPPTPFNDPWCFSKLPFACYSPIDLQSQRLTCDTAYDYPAEQDEEKVLKHMKNAVFVGVVEAYQESVCVLHAQIQGKLPDWCDCTDEKTWESSPVHVEDHGAAHTDMDDISEEVLKKVDTLTKMDRKLYEEAVDRFMEDVKEVEHKFGTKIMCGDKPKLP